MTVVLPLDLGLDIGQHLGAFDGGLVAFAGFARLRRLGPIGDDALLVTVASDLQVHGVQQNLEDGAHVASLDRQDHALSEAALGEGALEGVLDARCLLGPSRQRGEVAVGKEGHPYSGARLGWRAGPRGAGERTSREEGKDCGQAEHQRSHPASYLNR